MKHIHEVVHRDLAWINVTRQSESVLQELKKRFFLSEDDIKECLPNFQRPKIVKRPDYYFMVLHFPVFDRETRRLGITEVDFFLSANYLITVHDDKLSSAGFFFDECKKNTSFRDELFRGTAVHILFELLSRLLDAIFPILLHVNDDINLVDKKLFSSISEREMIQEILRLKTNTVTFRRAMQGHKTVLERLIMHSGRDLDIGSYQSHVNSLREFSNEIWHILESQRESIDALHQTNESIVSVRTSQVMKTLTIISVITFPLTLFATLVNFASSSNPFLTMPFGFLIICSISVMVACFMLSVFIKKKWL